MTHHSSKINRRDFLLYTLLGGGLVAAVGPNLIKLIADTFKADSVTTLNTDAKVLNYGRGPELFIMYHKDNQIDEISVEPGLVQAMDKYPVQSTPEVAHVLASRKASPIHNPYAALNFSAAQRRAIQDVARNAWNFIHTYTQPNGLIMPYVVHDSAIQNDTSESQVACWELGSMILALIAAARIQLIDESEASFRLKTLLVTIAGLDTYKGYFTSFYDTVTAKRIDPSSPDFVDGLEAVDVGRLLIGLYAVQQNYPEFGEIAAQILAKLPLDQLIPDGNLSAVDYNGGSSTESIHPLSEYASLGFSLFGKPTAYQTSPVDHEQVKVSGYEFYLPSEGTITAILGPYLYQIFEIPYLSHTLALPIIEKIMQASQLREQATGLLTAVTEGSSIRRGASNLYCAVVSRKDGAYRAFPVFHNPASQPIDDTFSMDSLRFASTGGVLSQLILNQVLHTQFDWSTRMSYLKSAYIPGQGFYNGRYDSDKHWNLDLDLNNHALILEAAAFALTGTPLTQKSGVVEAF